MSTNLLERPDVVFDEQSAVPEDPNKTRHFFPKSAFDAFFLSGTPMVALCGFVKTTPPQSQGDEPICSKCLDIYQNFDWVPHGPEDGEPPL